jgi:hypothetical protein
MIEDLYFLDDEQVKITAASVGISKQRWAYVKESEINSEKHIDLMTTNRFDHLPIVSANGLVYELFKTKQSNDYSEINRIKIQVDDILPLDTHIRDVMEKFSEERTFFFLTYQKKNSGLITIGNLNCKQVQVYIFSIICELERELANFLNFELSTEEIKNWLKEKEKPNDPNCRYKNILTEFNKLVSFGLENQITEHFFLVDFFKIIKGRELYSRLEYSKDKWKELSSINELRKRIAHPTRSLLDHENPISKLKGRLKKVEELLFKLSTYKHTAIIKEQYSSLF